MQNKNPRHRIARSASSLLAASIAAIAMNGIAAAQANDPVIFSFATVGDSRTDPGKPDATTLLANPSPATQGGVPSLTGDHTAAGQRVGAEHEGAGHHLTGIQTQNPNLLFFNGDMIFGYGRPTLPNAWANGQPNSWDHHAKRDPRTSSSKLRSTRTGAAWWRICFRPAPT